MKTIDAYPGSVGTPSFANVRVLPQGRGRRVGSAPVAADFYPTWILYGFIGTEILCQVLLLFPLFSNLRIVMRTFAFAGSLACLLFLRRPAQSYPATKAAVLALVIVSLSIFHPTTVSAWAGLATVFLYASILGPIFWVPRIRMDANTVRTIFLLFWAFNTASAVVGALQVYFPGHLQPEISTAISDDAYRDALKIELADGTRVYRPMGLTDGPGGACLGALYSVILGIGLLFDKPRPWFRAVVIASMPIALFSLYLTQVRSVLVMLVISVLSLGLPLALQRRVGRFMSLIALMVAIGLVAFTLAISIGGDTVFNRLATLWEASPGTVYYTNRGIFLEYTFVDLLPQFPLGIGLGRWGMINAYFGQVLGAPRPMWAEINWTGWLYDGGLPLVIAYGAAILAALRTSLKVAKQEYEAPNESVQRWAGIVFGYGVGALASTFNACIFSTTMGVDFWILSSAVFAASCQVTKARSA